MHTHTHTHTHKRTHTSAHTNTHTHKNAHTREDSHTGEIGLSQRPLSDNTQQSQQTPIRLEGFEPIVPRSVQPQTYILDRAATRIGRN